jgi:hypothetical protein
MLKRWMAGEDLEADLQGKGVTNLPHITSVSIFRLFTMYYILYSFEVRKDVRPI